MPDHFQNKAGGQPLFEKKKSKYSTEVVGGGFPVVHGVCNLSQKNFPFPVRWSVVEWNGLRFNFAVGWVQTLQSGGCFVLSWNHLRTVQPCAAQLSISVKLILCSPHSSAVHCIPSQSTDSQTSDQSKIEIYFCSDTVPCRSNWNALLDIAMQQLLYKHTEADC